ncbi:MAG: hypothetical protein AABY75_00005, partial [Bacteroidota bacterium]
MKLSFLLLPLLLVVAVAVAAVIKDRPSANSNGSDIILRWNTESESGVQQFVVVRRSGIEGEFIPVT